METPDTHRVPHHAQLGPWEMVIRAPDVRLRTHVTAYHGYVEQGPGLVQRREVASSDVVLVINFGPAWRLRPAAEPAPVAVHSFIAGVADAYTLSESTGPAYCLQVTFTPLGAYQFFGVPMDELANRVIPFDDLAGPLGRELPERLYAAATWEARFALLDALLAARFAEARSPSPAVARAWQLLTATHGQIEIGTLAEEIGWSRKHLNLRLREQIGLSPKALARVLRFQRAIHLLERAPGGSLTDVAYECGYYDQAHFIRDFRVFAGATPGTFLGRQVPIGADSRDAG